MKLKQFLEEVYEQQPLEDEVERSVRYAYKHLSYLGNRNESLKTSNFLSYGEEREVELTGEEDVVSGVYLLYTDAHEGSETLVEQDDLESALIKQKEWNDIGFNPYDYCSLVIVEN